MRRDGVWPVLVLAGVVVVAATLRMYALDFGLPYLYHPDEPNKIEIAQRIFKTGDLNPHYFLKPSLLLYLNAAAYVPYYWLGELAGVFRSPAEIREPLMLAMAVGRSETPSTVLLGRSITVLVGVLAVVMTYVTSVRLYGRRWAGVLAALLVALSPTQVEHSRLISVDMFVVFFCLLVLYFSVGILRRGRWVDFLLAGVAGGLVVAFKYPGVLVAVIPVAAVLFRRGWRGLLEPKLYAGLALIPLVFLLTTPYAVLDSQKFLADALYESSHYATGHPGMEGNSPTWYLGFLFQTEGFVALLAVVELLRALVRRERTSLLVGVFPAVYFVFIGSFEVRNDRTILPMLAFLALLAAHLLALVAGRIRAVSAPPARWLAWTGYGLLVLALLAVPAYGSVEASSALARDDGRAQARVWIEQNIPPGAKVALESYAPFVDPARYEIQGLHQLIDHPAQWYFDNGFDYLVFSEGWYGRFYADPARYGTAIGLYEALFAAFEEEQSFPDPGLDVRVFRVPQD